MKYVFNGFLFSQRPTGVMRYAKEILLEMDKLCVKDQFELVVPEYANNVPDLKNITIKQYGKTRGNLWEQIDFYTYVKRNKVQSVNFNNTMPILKPGIIVIHDIAYKLHPEFANSIHGKLSNIYHRAIFRRAAKSKVKIVTVTYFSKMQIIDEYHVDPARITVIGNAWQHFDAVGVDETILRDNELKKNGYYFSLGSLSKMKNTQWFIEVAKKNPDSVFVLAGAKPNNAVFSTEKLKNLILVGFVTDQQVKALIKNCRAFIYPSVYDGFGIPPLEALSQGAKVICSCAACLPEVYGNSVHYIDPYDTNVELEKILSEPVDTAERVLEKYNWKKSAREFYELLINE